MRGTPNMKLLPLSTNLARPYFIYSTILQVILLLIFVFYFGISILRVAKKIKNSKFKDVPDPN
jgi:hypothetical protein